MTKLFLIIQHSPHLANSRAPPHLPQTPLWKFPSPTLVATVEINSNLHVPPWRRRQRLAKSKVTEIWWVTAQSPRGGLQSKGNYQGGLKVNGLEMGPVEFFESADMLKTVSKKNRSVLEHLCEHLFPFLSLHTSCNAASRRPCLFHQRIMPVWTRYS